MDVISATIIHQSTACNLLKALAAGA